MRHIPSLLILLFVCTVSFSSRTESPVFDEPINVAAGYSYLKTGALRFNPEHPHLAKILMALPLLPLRLEIRESDPVMTESPSRPRRMVLAHKLFNRWNPEPDIIFNLARLPSLCASLCLALLLYAFVRGVADKARACLALGLYCASPEMIAHSGLATQDIFLALGVFASFHFFIRPWRGFSLPGLLMLSASISFAMLSKANGFLIFPILLLLCLLPSRFKNGPACGIPKRIMFLASASALALIIVAASYGFGGFLSPKRFPFPAGVFVSSVSSFAGFFLPTRYFDALSWQFAHASLGHYLTFLNGSLSNSPSVLYFPEAILLKMPLPMLALIAISAFGILRPGSEARKSAPALLLPAGMIFAAVALFGNIQIGIRYLLPCWPFVFAFTAISAGEMAATAVSRITVGTLAAASLASTLFAFPHYLSYFNEIAGGGPGGYRYLSDSNVDWGQDLRRLGAFVEREKKGDIWLSYFGLIDPRVYGIKFRLLPSPPFQPWANEFEGEKGGCGRVSGTVAVSVTNYHGAYLDYPPCFRWLDSFRPSARVGNSILVYEIPEER